MTSSGAHCRESAPRRTGQHQHICSTMRSNESWQSAPLDQDTYLVSARKVVRDREIRHDDREDSETQQVSLCTFAQLDEEPVFEVPDAVPRVHERRRKQRQDEPELCRHMKNREIASWRVMCCGDINRLATSLRTFVSGVAVEEDGPDDRVSEILLQTLQNPVLHQSARTQQAETKTALRMQSAMHALGL